MKKVLGIYGAGGLGREVLELADIINMQSHYWEKIIFIDDNNNLKEINNAKVYAYQEAKELYKDTIESVIAIGEPEIKCKLYEKLLYDKIDFATLIHPDIHIPKTTSIGKGTIINVGAFISCNMKIEENVYIQPHVNIGHDCVLRMGCVISGFVNIGGDCYIGKSSYIGLSTCVKQGIRIGDGTIIGMASAVYKDIPSDVIAMGNPARIMKKNENKRVFC